MISENIDIAAARNGSKTVRYNNLWIHSRYSPEKEAAAFVSTLNGCENIRCFILIGDGLGYISSALLDRFSSASLLTVSLCDTKESPLLSSLQNERFSCWHGKSHEELFSFLAGTVPEFAVSHLKIVHWLPAFKAAPHWSSEILKTVGEAVSLLSANQATIRGFSKKWMHNSISNLFSGTGNGNMYNIAQGSSSIVIAASGPGLSESFPAMREYRDRFLLCALPSSIEALYYSGLIPDIIINADAGFWARFHLTRPAIYGKHEKKPFLYSSLAAGIPSDSRSFSFSDYYSGTGFFIEQDSPFISASAPLLQLPARGTVAANALDICSRCTSGNIYITGLDLAAHDLQFHVRPHSFDTIFHSMSRRHQPETGIRFQRALDSGFKGEHSLKSDSSLDIYYRFFSGTAFNGRVFRISSSFSRSFNPDSSAAAGDNSDFAERLSHSSPREELSLESLSGSDLRSMLFTQLERRIDRLVSMGKKELTLLLQKGSRFRSSEETVLVHLAGLLDHEYALDPEKIRSEATRLKERIKHGPKLYS